MTVTTPSTKCSLRSTCRSWPHISLNEYVNAFSGMVWDDLQEQGEKILSSPKFYFYLNIINYRNVCFSVFRNGTLGICFWEGRLMAAISLLVSWCSCWVSDMQLSRNEFLWPCPWKGSGYQREASSGDGAWDCTCSPFSTHFLLCDAHRAVKGQRVQNGDDGYQTLKHMEAMINLTGIVWK